VNNLKIAICGKMASGKTTMADWLVTQHGYKKASLAGKVKEIARDLFQMKEKDRPLLQKIGMKMREVRASVWIDYVIGVGDRYEDIVIDDVRFVNEAKALQEAGWTVIRLNIDDDTQKERLKKTYADWEVHWNNRDDPSELEVDQIPAEYVNMELGANFDDYGSLIRSV